MSYKWIKNLSDIVRCVFTFFRGRNWLRERSLSKLLCHRLGASFEPYLFSSTLLEE